MTRYLEGFFSSLMVYEIFPTFIFPPWKTHVSRGPRDSQGLRDFSEKQLEILLCSWFAAKKILNCSQGFCGLMKAKLQMAKWLVVMNGHVQLNIFHIDLTAPKYFEIIQNCVNQTIGNLLFQDIIEHLYKLQE